MKIAVAHLCDGSRVGLIPEYISNIAEISDSTKKQTNMIPRNVNTGLLYNKDVLYITETFDEFLELLAKV